MDNGAKMIAANLLELASDSFSNHGCNDYVLANTEDNRGFVRAMHAWEGLEGEDAEPHISPDGNQIYTQDFAVMSYCSHLLTKEVGESAE